MDKATFILLMGQRVGIRYTQEQIDFISDFDKTMLSFSLPGTGKTATAVAGLICAEVMDKIPPTSIYALSFTRMATLELKDRHYKFASAFGLKSKVHFSTLSALCLAIVKKHCSVLGMSTVNVQETEGLSSEVSAVEATAQDLGAELRTYEARRIRDALAFANSTFIYDKCHLESRYDFIQAQVPVDFFTRIRSSMYEFNKIMNVMPIGDVFAYALEIFLRRPDIAQEYRNKIRVLLVDEFQDMSALQLMVISQLSDHVVAIGDINQQIYAFNGACNDIVTKFKELFPNYVEHNLTQSFRCADEIAEFSRNIIVPNKTHGEDIKGTGKSGVVTIEESGSLHDVISKIADGYYQNKHYDDIIFFMYRNNISSVPIAEDLFNAKLPFYMNDFIPLNRRPIMRDICSFIDLVNNPRDPERLFILSRFLPEFRYCRGSANIPLYGIMQETGLPWTSINFRYDRPRDQERLFDLVTRVQELLEEHSPFTGIYSEIFTVYYSTYFRSIEDKVDVRAEEILRALEYCCGDKTFNQFILHETEKMKFIQNNLNNREGIRLLTFHAAKGLEADVVYIFDANQGIIPSSKKLRKMYDANCVLDVAREVRNERSLIYVACTRARRELHIFHSGNLSSIFTNVNQYQAFDNAYANSDQHFDDLQAFKEFTGVV